MRISRTKLLRWHEACTGWTFLLPGVFVVGLCVFMPVVLAFVLSFTRCSRFLTVDWVGLDNYVRLLSDPGALNALRNTLFYVVVFVPTNMILSLLVAVLLDQKFPGMKIIRSVYFVPVAVSGVVTISIFRFILDRNYGPLNAFLSTLGFEPVGWLMHADWAMWAVILLSLWKSVAFFTIILLAALQGVRKDLHEAAMVDGASPVLRFFHVTLPSIKGVVMTMLILSSIGAFRIFEPMFVLTKGGPADSTRTISLLAYDSAFGRGELGYANAISFTLMAVILLVTWVLNKFSEDKS